MSFKVQVGPPQIAIHQGQTVLVTGLDGQIAWPSEKGLYFLDTRIISNWAIYANGEPWELLNGGPINYYSARIFLTNKSILTEDGPIPPRALGLTISRSISGGLHEDLEITNNSMKPVRFQLEVAFRSDFADIFEVKSGHIVRRGQITTEWSERRQRLRTTYNALKGFVGTATTEFNSDQIDEAAWKRLVESMSYIRGDFNDPDTYVRLGKHLDDAAQKHQTAGNVIFYLAVADRFFGPVVDKLGQSKLVKKLEQDGEPKCWRRVVIEKPFGHSLESARELNARILRTLHEDQIFRIDHFVGKDTVQNIMALRFANGIFEPIWNRDRIDHVQITAAETVGVEQRGKFYEATGALRDMVPNHLFALLSLVAMEPPTTFNAASIHTQKAEVFAAIPAARPERAIRGQYGPGTVLGRPVKGYRQEPNVAADSNVETYVAMRLEIDNWRWAGVPFYLRTGKHLSRRMTEIAISFKRAPYAPFRDTLVDRLSPNWLTLEIAPGECISLQFEARRPGPAMDLAAVRMDFHYDDWFPKEPSVGYETLLHDVMIGDQTRFTRADMVEHAWRVVQPVLDAWAMEKADFPIYESGSDGPNAADALLAGDCGRAWRPLVPSSGTKQ